VFSNGGEIGAATGLEFLPAGHVLAAAEPVRRGGGSAMVEHP
jgi:gamma-glutamyltranspeptidase/glutathione hydrolase